MVANSECAVALNESNEKWKKCQNFNNRSLDSFHIRIEISASLNHSLNAI